METSTFNPFKPREFSRAQVEKIFGPKSDAKLAQQTAQENPGLYKAIRAQAVSDGLVGNVPVPYANWRMPSDRKFSDREIEVRSKHSEQECRELFGKSGDTGGVKNVGRLYAENPAAYAELREAAVSYNLISATQPAPVVHTDKPARQDDGAVLLSDDNCDKLNLPRNTKVSAQQYEKIVTILNPVSDGTKES